MAFRSPNRKHDRQYFYKYVTSEVAKIALTNRTLRWSSPLRFNDPRDVPRDLFSGFGDSQLLAAVLNEEADIIEEGRQTSEPRIQHIQATLSRNGTSELRTQSADKIRSLSTTGCFPQGSPIEEGEESWQNYLRRLRILCLSDVSNSTPMWHRYAGNCQGALLRLECLDIYDSCWLLARKIIYQESPQQKLTNDEWVKWITEQIVIDFHERFNRSLYVKNTSWAYEREWRVVSFAPPGDSGLFSDNSFNPRELNAIYLGKDIREQDRADILALLDLGLEHVEVHQAYIEPGQNTFGYKRIK